MPEEEKLGIENIKETIKWGYGVAKDYQKAMEDGKYDVVKDSLLFIDDALKIPKFIGHARKAAKELLDLDRVEDAQLTQWIIDEFDVPEGKVQNFARACIKVAIDASSLTGSILDLVDAIKELKDKE